MPYSYQITCDHTGSCKDGGPDPEDAIYDIRNAAIPTGLAGSAYVRVTCSVCGCEYEARIQSGGSGLETADIAQPRIDSLGTASGPLAGGTSVQISGHRLNTTGVSVKFNGVAATGITGQTDGSLTCDTPAGSLKLNGQSRRRQKLPMDNVSGTFQVGEDVAGATSEATAKVREVESTYLLVDMVDGTFQNDEQIDGMTSGATADVDGTLADPFTVDETVTGGTSGSTATVDSVWPLRVTSPSAAFTAGEWVSGGTSGCKMQLDGTTPMDGSVDVSVENDNGQRTSGGTLTSSFEYTL